jgi:DNA-binding MurR/RpiR family transcriptional regulator
MADICIFSSTNDAAYYTESMVSRLVQLVIMDMLVVAYSTRLDDTMAREAIEVSDMAVSEMKIHNSEVEK